ncbi:MAG: efflux RND transporter permease subunit [Lachnospiraceae bacterium]|nr:efflux RND transporter permease subunit [Lachnospiraceae bacterium]
MEKLSVKKPFTVLVAVLIILILGVVSALRIPTDLLPSISLPYMIVITPYPGASPERVEAMVSVPMERSLGTVSHVKNVTSTSAENYSMVQLEFEDGTDMDSAMVKVSSSVEQVRGQLPAECGTPSIIEISMDMIATMYLAVSRDGYDIYELSEFIEDEVVPYFERQEGAASVSTIGLVEKSIQVDLNAVKIQELNDRILEKTDSALAQARKQLDDAKRQVEDGQSELESQERRFGSTVASGMMSQLEPGTGDLQVRLKESITQMYQRLDALQNSVNGMNGVGSGLAGDIGGAMQNFQNAYWEAFYDYFNARRASENALKASEKTVEEMNEAVEKALEEKEQERQEQQNEENKQEGQDPPQEQAHQEEQAPPQEQTPQEEQTPPQEQTPQEGQTPPQENTPQDEQTPPQEQPTQEQQSTQEEPGNAAAEPVYINTEEPPAEPSADQPTDTSADPGTDVPEPAESSDTGMTGRSISAPGGLGNLYSDKPSDHIILHSGGQRLLIRTAAYDTADEEGDDPFADIPEELPDEIRQRIEEAYEDVETAAEAAGEYLSREEVTARLESARKDLEDAYTALDGGSISSIAAGISKLVSAEARIQSLMERIQKADTAGSLNQPVSRIYEALRQMDEGIEQLPQMMDSLEQGLSMLTQGQLDAALGFSQAANGLFTMQQQLEQASAQYESARTEALKSANIDTLVTAPMLSQLIYAQNFSMPAGYIDDQDDRSWLLKIGEEFDTSEDIAGALLADIDGIGTIRLSDVADITVIDNAGVSYTKLNGQNGVVVSIYKSSTASTSEVSEACKKAVKELMEDKPGTNVVILMDQGSYIRLIVSDILSSMALGAFLAVIVLALFLRDVRPTIMVGISIPLSVLFTMVLMYFSNLSLNIMTMAGISLGIGMLVDNSIVVMENIIRLRQRGTSPARASVQGAKQVSGSIIASTLTTICVFLPMVFTTGTVRELLLPMALSITYCLTASLIVAMTVIPASASVILKRIRPKRRSLFDRILDRYGTTLAWTLHHKLIVMAVAIGLLAFCIWRLIVMGIVMLPDMSSDTIQVDIRTPAGLDREESYAMADEIAERIMSIDGVADVGIMDSSSTAGLISVMTTSSGGYGSYLSYIIAEDNSRKNLDRISGEIKEATDDLLEGSVKVAETAMGDMTALMPSGLSVNIYGTDLDMLYDTGNAVADSVMDIHGFTNVRNSAGAQEQSLLLHIDKDKAMGMGLTVAQIYAEIAGRMQTEVTSTSITTDGITLTVHVRDETKPLTRENLLDLEFKTQSMFPQMPAAGDTEAAGEADGSGGEEAESGPDDEADLADLMSLFGGASASPKEEIHKLREFATLEETLSPRAINRENQSRYVTVSADTMPGYNTTLLSRQLEESVDRMNASLPHGYSVEIGGESSQVNEMIVQMAKMLLLALAFIYLVMVAQFQSLLSPFIILFTIPLAFTGGMIALLITREQLSMLALMGFLVLMGTVVNNGIVFVDYTNQLRIGGLGRQDALIAAGKTRMRPILMTALTTILAMTQLIFGDGMGAQISRAMALVISGGLIYATLMTLYIVPLVYDILYKKQPLSVDVDSDIDDAPDDAAEFLAELNRREEAYEEEMPVIPEDDADGEDEYDYDPDADWDDGIDDMDTTELE